MTVILSTYNPQTYSGIKSIRIEKGMTVIRWNDGSTPLVTASALLTLTWAERDSIHYGMMSPAVARFLKTQRIGIFSDFFCIVDLLLARFPIARKPRAKKEKTRFAVTDWN